MSQPPDRTAEERVEAKELAAKYCAERDARYPYNLPLINAFIAGHTSRDAEVEELREALREIHKISVKSIHLVNRVVASICDTALQGATDD